MVSEIYSSELFSTISFKRHKELNSPNNSDDDVSEGTLSIRFTGKIRENLREIHQIAIASNYPVHFIH